MRTRVRMLAVLCGLAVMAVPAVASAAPHHNRGLTINVTPNPILSGSDLLIYGQLAGPNNANQAIYLYHRINPADHFSIIQVGRTNSVGFYEFTRPDGIVLTNRSWFVRGPADTHSRTVHERVAALVSLNAVPTTATTADPIQFSGSISPNHPFQVVRIQVQGSNEGNGWRTIETTRTNASSQFSVAHRFRVPNDYTVRAVFPTDPRNIRGESDSVTVSVQQAQVPTFTIKSTSPITPEGTAAMIEGVAEDKTGAALASTQVTLYGRQDGGTFEALTTTVTDASGNYSFNVTPVHNTVYFVAETLKPAHRSARLFEGVQDTLTINSSSSTATVGGSVTVSGTVSPDKTGHVIWLQQLGADGNWHDVMESTVTTGSSYSFTDTPGQAGTLQLRARIYGGPENVGGASAPVSISVSGVAPLSSLPPAS